MLSPRAQFRVLIFILAAVAGWLDGVAFVVLGKVFVSVVTGNFVILGIVISDRAWTGIARVVVVLAANAVGVLTGAMIVRRRGIEAWRVGPRPVLALEGGLLVAAAVTWSVIGDPAGEAAAELTLLTLITFAMGLQAAFVASLDVPALSVNYLTGLFTNVAGSMATRVTHSTPPRIGVPGWVVGVIVGCYVAAAFTLGRLDTHSAVLVWIPAVLVGAALVVTWHTDADESSDGTVS